MNVSKRIIFIVLVLSFFSIKHPQALAMIQPALRAAPVVMQYLRSIPHATLVAYRDAAMATIGLTAATRRESVNTNQVKVQPAVRRPPKKQDTVSIPIVAQVLTPNKEQKLPSKEKSKAIVPAVGIIKNANTKGAEKHNARASKQSEAVALVKGKPSSQVSTSSKNQDKPILLPLPNYYTGHIEIPSGARLQSHMAQRNYQQSVHNGYIHAQMQKTFDGIAIAQAKQAQEVWATLTDQEKVAALEDATRLRALDEYARSQEGGFFESLEPVGDALKSGVKSVGSAIHSGVEGVKRLFGSGKKATASAIATNSSRALASPLPVLDTILTPPSGTQILRGTPLNQSDCPLYKQKFDKALVDLDKELTPASEAFKFLDDAKEAKAVLQVQPPELLSRVKNSFIQAVDKVSDEFMEEGTALIAESIVDWFMDSGEINPRIVVQEHVYVPKGHPTNVLESYKGTMGACAYNPFANYAANNTYKINGHQPLVGPCAFNPFNQADQSFVKKSDLLAEQKRCEQAARESLAQKKALAKSKAIEKKSPLQQARQEVNNIADGILFRHGNTIQIPSIDQRNYENQNQNIVDGFNMCGHFAVFNGSMLLDAVMGNISKQALSQRLQVEHFNQWLLEHGSVVNPVENRNDIHSGVIEQLIENRHRPYTSVFEIGNLASYFVQDEAGNDLFLPLDDTLINTINNIRQFAVPHLVLLNTGNHWITILLDGEKTVVLDSMAGNQTNNEYVNFVRHLFTEQEMPDLSTVDALRQRYRPDVDARVFNAQQRRGKKKQSQKKKEAVASKAAQAPGQDPESDSDDEQNKNDGSITFFEKNTKHIFRNEEGHFKQDTPANRKIIMNLVNDRKNFVGQKLLGPRNPKIEIYSKILKNGTQVWAEVWKRTIRNGGINKIPKVYDTVAGRLI